LMMKFVYWIGLLDKFENLNSMIPREFDVSWVQISVDKSLKFAIEKWMVFL